MGKHKGLSLCGMNFTKIARTTVEGISFCLIFRASERTDEETLGLTAHVTSFRLSHGWETWSGAGEVPASLHHSAHRATLGAPVSVHGASQSSHKGYITGRISAVARQSHLVNSPMQSGDKLTELERVWLPRLLWAGIPKARG